MNKRMVVGASIAVSLIVLLLAVGVIFTRSMFGGMTKSMGDVQSEAGIGSAGRYYPSAPMQNVQIIGSSGSSKSGSSPAGTTMPTPSPEETGYGAMYFEDYGTNTFSETSKDRLSTFALDVDSASYTVAKNYIMRGELPPTDAIRPEEFVNYFDYGYASPRSAFAIYPEVSTSPFDEGMHYLRVGIKGREVDERKDAILTFVVDTSGSMDMETRIGLVKRSMRFLVDQLREGDEVAIVTYNTEASLLLEHTSIQEKQKIIDAIDSLRAGGSTNADAGLKLGYETAAKRLKEGKINRVVLLSDGVANVGDTDPESMINRLSEYTGMGISLTAVGVGMGNYNDVLLEKIADKGDGNYYYVNEFPEAKRIFSGQLTGTLQILGKDTKVQVDFNPDTVLKYRLVGYENRAIADDSFRDDSQDAGEVGAGHEVTAIYEIVLTGKEGILGKVYLRYKDPDSGEAKEISEDIKQDIRQFDQSSESFRLAVSSARFAQILKMVQPPPSISKVDEIASGLEGDDMVDDFKIVVSNAKRLIEIKSGE